MFTDKIDLNLAIQQEELGNLIIFDTGMDHNNSYHPKADYWKDNFIKIRTKFRNTDVEKLPEVIQAKYTIEIKQHNADGSIQWRFLRAVPSKDLSHIIHSNTEYIYVLTNPAHQDKVKIGMTRGTAENRLKQINGTGVIDRWKLRFYLGVKPQTSYIIEQSVHKAFSNQRYQIQRQNDTEIFCITVEQAIEKILEVGALHKVAEPQYFD